MAQCLQFSSFTCVVLLFFHRGIISQGFPKVDHSGIDAKIVLEQINSAKRKLPLTGIEPSTLGLSVLLTFYLSCLTPVLDPIA